MSPSIDVFMIRSLIAAMRFFTLALPLEVDGSPAPSPPARRQAFVQKCTFDRRPLGPVVVPFHFPSSPITPGAGIGTGISNDFTPRAQKVLTLARKEAEWFNHNYVGTEHLLLGLIKLGQGVAVNVLQNMGLDLKTVRMEVEKHVGSHPETNTIGNIPYTPRVKKVLALAPKEAKPF